MSDLAKIAEIAIPFKIHFEGKHAKMYKCPAGYPTIGIGHKINLLTEKHLLYATLSELEISQLFMKDLAWAEKESRGMFPANVWNSLSIGWKFAIIDMTFNGGTMLRGTTTWKLIMAGDLKKAAERLLLWNKADLDHDGVVEAHEILGGLTRRCHARKHLADGGTIKQLEEKGWFMHLLKR